MSACLGARGQACNSFYVSESEDAELLRLLLVTLVPTFLNSVFLSLCHFQYFSVALDFKEKHQRQFHRKVTCNLSVARTKGKEEKVSCSNSLCFLAGWS